MSAAVLLYHSQNISGNAYAQNDHVALASDLNALRRRGIKVVPLASVVEALLSGKPETFPNATVAVTCDDGSLLDWEDYDHPEHGWQPSFDRILRQHMLVTGVRQPGLLTSFLIASPQARLQIDSLCYGGRPLSDSRWWQEAARSGRIMMGNHSWDHAHISLPVAVQGGLHGSFFGVTNETEADRQIAQATDFLDELLAPAATRVRWLAYPYGHCTDYLAEDYLPSHRNRHRMEAAFTTEAAFVTPDTPLYRIPRFVCGDAWRSPEDFNQLLDCLSKRTAS